MKCLEERIEEDGVIINENILKVDKFLNQQIDVELIERLAEEFFQVFQNRGITKVITIEASGIAPAVLVGLKLGIPVIFLKKSLPKTMDSYYSSIINSHTKGRKYSIYMDKYLLDENDKVLFIDDFLGNGETFKGIEDIVRQSDSEIEGVGIVIEKSFQSGRKYIENQGYDIYSLARISNMKNSKIIFEREW